MGLDVGTTGVKAVAFGPGSSWRRVAIREYPLLQPAPDQAVQDPDAIVSAATDALAECVGAAAGAEVLAVAVSAAMHGLIGLDSELRPLTPLITWADARAWEEALSLQQSGVDLQALTGVPVHPMTPLAKLLWFARHEPQTLTAALWWIGLKDYLLAWLTGRLVTELSSASGTGLLDMKARTWSATAIELAGVRPEQLPEILPTTFQLPLDAGVARQVGLPGGTPVLVGAADGPLGNLGTGAIAPGLIGLSLGTSGAARMAVPEPSVDRGRTLFCFALTDSVWVIGGAISNGGSVARWVEQSLTPDVRPAGEGPDQAMLELAGSVPAGSDGVVMLPYLLAERAPLWDPGLLGAFLGLRREHTRAHLVRAAVEGVCIQMRLIVDRLDEIAPVHAVRATGGVFRSALWGEVMAAMLGRPVQIVGEAAGTALGAAALGLLGLGWTTTLADAVSALADPNAPAPPRIDADPPASRDLRPVTSRDPPADSRARPRSRPVRGQRTVDTMTKQPQMAKLPAPSEGIALTHFIVSDDIERSRRFDTEMFGGVVALDDEPTIVALTSSRPARANATSSSALPSRLALWTCGSSQLVAGPSEGFVGRAPAAIARTTIDRAPTAATAGRRRGQRSSRCCAFCSALLMGKSPCVFPPACNPFGPWSRE